MKNDIKKYLSLGAVLAGSAFMVSCDGDTVVAADNTNVTPTVASKTAPTVAQITGKNILFTGTTGNTSNVANISVGQGVQRFVFATGTSFLRTAGNVAYNYNYSNTGNTFTMANIVRVGTVTPAAVTQLNLNALVAGETAVNARDSNQESTVLANAQIRLRSAQNAGTRLDLLIGYIFDNNRYKRDAGIELSGTGGTYDIPANGDLHDQGGHLYSPAQLAAAIVPGDTINSILFTKLPGLNARLDANNTAFSGYRNLLVSLEAQALLPQYAADPVKSDLALVITAVKQAITALEGQIALVDAERPKLVQLATERFGTEAQDGNAGSTTNLHNLMVANHNVVGTVTRAFSNDNDFLTEGTFAETFTCTGARLVEVAAPISVGGVNYVAGDLRLVADATPQNKAVNGVFEIRNIGN